MKRKNVHISTRESTKKKVKKQVADDYMDVPYIPEPVDSSVISSYALSEQERQDIESFIRSVAPLVHHIHYTADATVLGGLKIQIGAWLFDATLLFQLETLAQTLKV
jgi:F0F1-type ATP synthase delta subunit